MLQSDDEVEFFLVKDFKGVVSTFQIDLLPVIFQWGNLSHCHEPPEPHISPNNLENPTTDGELRKNFTRRFRPWDRPSPHMGSRVQSCNSNAHTMFDFGNHYENPSVSGDVGTPMLCFFSSAASGLNTIQLRVHSGPQHMIMDVFLTYVLENTIMPNHILSFCFFLNRSTQCPSATWIRVMDPLTLMTSWSLLPKGSRSVFHFLAGATETPEEQEHRRNEELSRTVRLSDLDRDLFTVEANVVAKASPRHRPVHW